MFTLEEVRRVRIQIPGNLGLALPIFIHGLEKDKGLVCSTLGEHDC